MSNIHELPTRERLFDEASTWIAKLDRGLSKEEIKAFKQWMNASDENRNTLMDMALLWDKMDTLSRLSELFPTSSNPFSRCFSVFHDKKILCASIAASLVIFVLFVGLTISSSPSVSRWSSEVYASLFSVPDYNKTYETGIGEQSTIVLPDGSKLILNTDSLLHISYSKDNRLVTLERGEIHIEVAHDGDRPLSVRVGDRVVQAVGTAFNVQIYQDNKIELIVTDGIVRVGERKIFDSKLFNSHIVDDVNNDFESMHLPDSSLAIAKGEKVILDVSSPIVQTLQESEIDVSLSWRKGDLIFRGETLDEALREISRYTPVEIKIVDKRIENMRVAGLFKAGDVSGLLVALSDSFDIEAERVSENKVYLRSKSI